MEKSNYKSIAFVAIVIIFCGYLTLSWAEEDFVSPEQFFGFQPGADRHLINYEELVSYLTKLGKNSPRLKLINIGKSPLGKSIYIAFISSQENIGNLEELREINKRLALDPDIPDNEREKLIEKGKVFFLATLSMHSGEVGPSQSAPLIAYEWVTTNDPEQVEMLSNVVYMMVPCHNPDGMDMVVNHYRKYKNTKYEGSSLPGVYHKYVGHDNNRDFVNLTQKDNKAISDIYSTEWYPQVMIEKHQMGSTGPRYFVPPMHDPIAENVPAELWNWTWIFGSDMIQEMTKEGLYGVAQHYAFDDYWPGSTETCIWKNVIGMLTECASAKYATPVYVELNELQVRGKGLAEYKKSINMPQPWPGGKWGLSDIVQYEIVSTRAIIHTASLHRKEILEVRNDLCEKEVEHGTHIPPYYYILPLDQHDTSELVALVNLLKEHGVMVYSLSQDKILRNRVHKKGDIVIPLAQAFRPFIKEVMEKQIYPERHYTPGGKMIRPYDITSWSLPLHRGVESYEIICRDKQLEAALTLIDEEFTVKKEIPDNYIAVVLKVNNNESFKTAFQAEQNGLDVWRLEDSIETEDTTIPKGSFLIYRTKSNHKKVNSIIKNLKVPPVYVKKSFEFQMRELSLPRIGLVESFFHDMDAGWTRYVLDSYSIPYTVVHPGEFKETDFFKKFEVVIFPDENKSVLMKGRQEYGQREYISSYPPEFTKGIGKEGMEKLLIFLEKGGTIISWGRSSGLFLGILSINGKKDEKEEFQLPVRDISEELDKEGLQCPGSLMRVLLHDQHPITLGMKKEVGIFFRGRPVFETSVPQWDMDRRVIARFPERDILLSGYCNNEKLLANKTALVWLKKGKGQLVLFGFSPQFRGSTQGCFKLLFNAILLPGLK
ncbi:MAG: M14 family metallopeptidase [bacterium]